MVLRHLYLAENCADYDDGDDDGGNSDYGDAAADDDDGNRRITSKSQCRFCLISLIIILKKCISITVSDHLT